MKDRIKFSWLLLLLCLACNEKKTVLETEVITLNSTDQIVPVVDSLVRPVLYHNVPVLDGYTVEKSKELFIAIVLPAILIAKHHLTIERQKIERLSEKKHWSAEDSTYYQLQASRFKAKNVAGLLNRMTTHPNSIALAQAAVESGWGSSRFFREANNLFGIWAYNADEPRIAADGNNVYLRKYDDLSQSIEDYFVTLGRARPYRKFRAAKLETDDIYQLLPYLRHYSARGHDYIAQLKTIIKQNNLTQYDNFRIDPRYFVEK